MWLSWLSGVDHHVKPLFAELRCWTNTKPPQRLLLSLPSLCFIAGNQKRHKKRKLMSELQDLAGSYDGCSQMLGIIAMLDKEKRAVFKICYHPALQQWSTMRSHVFLFRNWLLRGELFVVWLGLDKKSEPTRHPATPFGNHQWCVCFFVQCLFALSPPNCCHVSTVEQPVLYYFLVFIDPATGSTKISDKH